MNVWMRRTTGVVVIAAGLVAAGATAASADNGIDQSTRTRTYNFTSNPSGNVTSGPASVSNTGSYTGSPSQTVAGNGDVSLPIGVGSGNTAASTAYGHSVSQGWFRTYLP